MLDGLEEYRFQDTTTFDLITPMGKVARSPTGEVGPDKEPAFETMTMTVRRMSSKIVQEFLNKRKNAQIREVKRTKNVSAESINEDASDMLIFCVVAWTGFRSKGKPLQCTPANVRTLLEDDTLVWIREQVDRAAGDDVAYLGNS